MKPRPRARRRLGRPTATVDQTPRPTDARDERLPRELFDGDYYQQRYPDVAASGQGPEAHFDEVGRSEGRCPSAGWALVERAVRLRAEVSATPAADIVALFPQHRRQQLATTEPWQRLRRMTHPALYAAQHDRAAGWTLDEVVDHYLATGAFEGLRPSALFHPGWYDRGLRAAGLAAPDPDDVPLLHWLTVGSHRRIVPTPLFDEDHYRARHPDLGAWRSWLFEHYVTHGAYEPGRQPSPTMAAVRHPDGGLAPAQRPVFLDQLLRSAGTVDLRRSSALEEAAMEVAGTLHRLAGPAMSGVVERAARLEPLLRVPPGPREVRHPPHSHHYVPLADVAQRVRGALPRGHAETVVLVPHLRTAGYRRVVTSLLSAWASSEPADRPLVVVTDHAGDDRPHVPAAVLDLAAQARDLAPDERKLLLLDLLRGLRPRRIVNVDSRLCWDTWDAYGRQLATWSRLVAHPVDWRSVPDGTPCGTYVGELQSCFGLLSGVLLGEDLHEELLGRAALSTTLRRRLAVAGAPVEERPRAGPEPSGRPMTSRPRAGWIGRSLDDADVTVLVQLAERMPDVDVRAWTTELAGAGPEPSGLPANLELCGDYPTPGDPRLDACDLVIVTSDAPTLRLALLDAAARACPVVAEQGGALVDEGTGYPVPRVADAPALVRTVERLLADRAEAGRRARALQSRVDRLGSPASYAEAVAVTLGGPT